MITENTQLVQDENGNLFYKDGETLIPASNTDVCKHYKTMQYNLMWMIGLHATDRPDLLQDSTHAHLLYELEYNQIPENAFRIK